MVEKLVHYGAYIANILLLMALAFLFVDTYGDQKLLVLLLFIPPILSMMALHQGADLEERRLRKRLNKARLQAELKKLDVQDDNTQVK